MHDDDTDRADRQANGAIPAANPPEPTATAHDDPLIAKLTAFVVMLEDRARRADERSQTEDIPDDVPRFRVWR